MTITLVPQGGGDPVTLESRDLDGDGLDEVVVGSARAGAIGGADGITGAAAGSLSLGQDVRWRRRVADLLPVKTQDDVARFHAHHRVFEGFDHLAALHLRVAALVAGFRRVLGILLHERVETRRILQQAKPEIAGRLLRFRLRPGFRLDEDM